MKHVAWLLTALLAGSLAPAQDMAELEGDHDPNPVFATPHTDWATPYALGKTRVLYFCRGHGCDPREAIELKQRFDLELQMVFWGRIVDSTNEGWHGAENGIRRMARLLTQKWDCFVFMDVAPEKMPVEQQFPLVKALTQGAGLVLLGTDDKRILKDKNKLKDLPAFLADVPGVEAFTIKSGRGVRLPKRPGIAYRPGWEVEYDEWDMRLGKAVLWAAGKEPKLSLTLTPKAAELARDTLPAHAVDIAWQGAGDTSGKTRLTLTLRRSDGATQRLAEPAIKSESNPGTPLQLPLVRCGDYFLDAIAREGKDVIGFASVPLKIVDDLAITELTLDREWAEIGESFAGSVALSQPLTGKQSLTLSVLDARGREISRVPSLPWGQGQKFQLKVQPWWPMLVRLQATVVDGGQEVTSAWKPAHVVKRHRGQFNFVMWDIPHGNLAPWAEQILARTGVTVHLSGGQRPPDFVAANEIAWVPYTTRILTPKDDQGVMKPACWNDEPMIQAHVDKIVSNYVPSRQHGVFVYSLGDEGDVRGSCLSPYCLAAYRRYLQGEYQDIAALNASWGTTYASFADVQLGRADDNEEADSLRAGNFPRWYDRQAYQSYNFCKLCERFGKGFRTIDPQSRCGFEGAGTFGAADDLDGFVRSNTFWSPYPGTADEVVRSIAPRDFPRSNWMGYTKDADSLLEKYWRMITRGCDSVWWWRWDCINRFHGWISPNLDPYPAVQEILRDTQIVRDGLGDLLLQSEMQTDSIGLLYSQPSAYAAKVQNSPTFGSYESNHAACHAALRELGLNFRYFTDRQMRLGEVDLSQFKVIFLPMTQALGPQEAQLFRRYVQDGGTLIADVRPAIYDGHVKPLGAGQLDDVFGIKRTGVGDAQIADGTLKAPGAGGKPEPLDLTKVRVDPGVTAAGASSAGTAGSVPLLLTHRFGKGSAVLLNLAMATFPSLSAQATPESAAVVLRTVLGAAQVSPALRLDNAKGERVRNIEITRWRSGPVQIVSLFRHAGQPEPARLTLPQAMYAYDLKQHKNLGKQQAFSLTITPYRAVFLALSPAPLQPATLQAAGAVARGGVQQVRVASALPQGQQAVKLTVKLPGGAEADWADQVVVVGKAGATVAVPVAFNDPAGPWTVSATDLYTGQTTSAQFNVK